MNKTQKSSIFALAIYLFCALLMLCALVNMFILKASAPSAFGAYLSMAAIFAMPVIAFFSLRRKQSPAEPDSDERDNTIKQKAAIVAFVAVWILLIAASIIPYSFVGQEGSIPVVILPLINLGVFLDTMAVYSIAVLIQYRKGGKDA
jgi:uncharacterized membrane-anchored protein